MTHQVIQYDAEDRPHGVWSDYWEDGTLRWRRQYLHGKLHGVWEHYWKDGTLAWRRHHHHGQEHGLWKWHSPDDTPYCKEYYINIK